MNYFQLLNRCRLELNYKEYASFAQFTKQDDLQLKNILNRVNNKIILSSPYYFRQKKTTLTVDTSIEFDISFSGKILQVKEDSTTYTYEPDYSKFYDGDSGSSSYGFFGGHILFNSASPSKTIDIYYLTNLPATDSTGASGKTEMALETDVSIIPTAYVDDVLVYGTCVEFGSKTKSPKYERWMNYYIDAIKRLNSDCLQSVEQFPQINISQPVFTQEEGSFRHLGY